MLHIGWYKCGLINLLSYGESKFLLSGVLNNPLRELMQDIISHKEVLTLGVRE